MALIDGIYMVLKDAELIENNNHEQSWNDFDANDFNFLIDYLKTTYESIVSLVNSSLAAFYEKLRNEFPDFKMDFSNLNTATTYDFISGSTVTINSVASSASFSNNRIF